MMRILPLALTFLLLSGDATGEVMCGLRETVVADLGSIHFEVQAHRGLATNGVVIEVLVSPSGSFTIIWTSPSGMTCVMAAGENWEDIKSKGDPV